MKIYTRTGDAGSTGLFGGPRVSKDDIRIESYGTVDELNAVIGLARSSNLPPDLDQQLDQIQHELFSIGAELATPDPEQFDLRVIGQTHINRLEALIDEHEEQLPELKQFILPGGSLSASYLHLARGTCRRAERRVVTLASQPDTDIANTVITYLNRLSDYLFVVTRVANQRESIPEVVWEKP